MPTGTDKSALFPTRYSRLCRNDGFLLSEGMAGYGEGRFCQREEWMGLKRRRRPSEKEKAV